MRAFYPTLGTEACFKGSQNDEDLDFRPSQTLEVEVSVGAEDQRAGEDRG